MIKNALKIDGWMEPDELQFLAERAKEAKLILEVGSYKGRSTTALCENTNGIVYSIDPYGGSYFNTQNEPIFNVGDEILNEFTKNLEYYLNTKKLIHKRTTLDKFESPFKFDFIFIDGDHRYNPLRLDINCAKRLIVDGGIISGHDYGRSDWSDVKRAVLDEFDLAKINTVNTIWWTCAD